MDHCTVPELERYSAEMFLRRGEAWEILHCEESKKKIQDHMLLGSIYDNVMLKTKYRDAKLSFLYNVMIGKSTGCCIIKN